MGNFTPVSPSSLSHSYVAVTQNDKVARTERKESDKPSHASNKQTQLAEFSKDYLKPEATADDVQKGIDKLQRDLFKGQGLFENKMGSLWKRTMPESACLAMIGIVVKVFGEKSLTDPQGNIDQKKLEMGMRMIFGKEMPKIEGDMLSKLKLKDGVLSSKHYYLSVGNDADKIAQNNQQGKDELAKLVTQYTIDQSFFHGKFKDEVENAFGKDILPTSLLNCCGKNFPQKGLVKKGTPEHIVALAKDMKQGKEIYSGQSTTTLENGKQFTRTLKCSFLVDSAPSLREKCKPEQLEKLEQLDPAVSKLPVNAWQATMTTTNEGGETKESHITLVGAQHTKNAEVNKNSAGQIFDAVEKSKPNNGKPKTSVINIVLLTGINKKVVTGSEEKVFRLHTEAMKAAASERGNFSYKAIHCEAHSHRDVAAAKAAGPVISVLGAAALAAAVVTTGPVVPLVLVGVAAVATTVGSEATDSVYESTTFSSGQDLQAASNEMDTLFNGMTKENQDKYRPVLTKWNELLPELHHERNTIPFATLSHILSDAISQDPNGDTNIEIIAGCKSAKDRTTSVLAGISMLEPLLQRELDKPGGGNIARFFDNNGFFNPGELNSDELVILKKTYDVSLLHVANKYNTGVEGNISSDILTDSFFKNVDFIHESEPYTVSLGS